MEEDKEAMYTTGAARCEVGEVLEEGLVHEQLYSDLEVQLEGEIDEDGEHWTICRLTSTASVSLFTYHEFITLHLLTMIVFYPSIYACIHKGIYSFTTPSPLPIYKIDYYLMLPHINIIYYHTYILNYIIMVNHIQYSNIIN